MMPERRERLQTMVRGLRKLFPRWLRRPNIEEGISQWLNTPEGGNFLRETLATIQATTLLQKMLPEVDSVVLEAEFNREAPRLFEEWIHRDYPKSTEAEIAKWSEGIGPSLEAAIKYRRIIRNGEYIGFSTRAALIAEGTRVVQRVIDEGKNFEK